jgi:tetratricopeptide (TPR) repeat protein
MKAFYKVKRAQAVIEPVIGRDSLLGLIFQLFEGLKDMFSRETQAKGFKMMKFVENKMLQFFENDDRNPYFEAVYISFYHYYNQLLEHNYDNTPEAIKYNARQIVYYLEKCLVIQLLAYGKYHSSVLSTFYGLGDAYQKLDDSQKAHHFFKEALDVAKRVPQKQDEMFEIMANMKYAQTDDCLKNKDAIFAKLDEVRAMIDNNHKLPAAEKR